MCQRGGDRGGALSPPDFGRSEGVAGSGGAPHYFMPPQIFRLWHMPALHLKIRTLLYYATALLLITPKVRNVRQFFQDYFVLEFLQNKKDLNDVTAVPFFCYWQLRKTKRGSCDVIKVLLIS